MEDLGDKDQRGSNQDGSFENFGAISGKPKSVSANEWATRNRRALVVGKKRNGIDLRDLHLWNPETGRLWGEVLSTNARAAGMVWGMQEAAAHMMDADAIAQMEEQADNDRHNNEDVA